MNGIIFYTKSDDRIIGLKNYVSWAAQCLVRSVNGSWLADLNFLCLQLIVCMQFEFAGFSITFVIFFFNF